jgi:succinate dehydrogenase / fumarate reductase, cytochrome b subunit
MAVRRPVSARPRNLDLTSIKLPVPAVVSILHRMSGFLLFLAIPILLWAMQTSLHSSQGYEDVVRILNHPFSKLVQFGLILAFVHHFLAGLRHLAIDLHWGAKLAQARVTAKLLLVLDALAAVIAIHWLV